MTEKLNSSTSWGKAISGSVLCAETERPSVEDDVLRLHSLLHRQLSRHVLSLGLNIGDADDLVQEAFIELFRHLLADRSRQNLPGWLFRVTHRMALKRRKQQRCNLVTADKVDVNSYATTGCSPEEEAIFNESQRRLLTIFLALPETDRLCLQLRSEGMNYREISNVLNISLGSVHNSLARSFNRLKGGQH
jgi:RNA polymerase sigma-70 factor (ECF subfamily)